MEERYDDWLEVQKKGWGVPDEGIKYLRANKEKTLSDKKRVTYISYHDGVPGGAASYAILEGYAFLFGGAVAESLRGKGLYRDLITARFKDLKELKELNLPAVIWCVSDTFRTYISKTWLQESM